MKNKENRHILIIEDSKDDAVLFSHVIRNVLKLNATIVHDGRQALTVAGQDHFDLILVDMNLPGLTGNLVTTELRRMESYTTTPIIAITAYDHAAVRQSSLNAGCDIFLTKPVDVDTLAEIVQLYLLRVRPKQ